MFACAKCDSQYNKWVGRCATCGGWGTIAEEGATSTGRPTSKNKAAPAPMLALGAANFTAIAHKPTGITELDRVLGGGIVPGGVTLLAGEPGIGKSTLVAQIASAMAKTDTPAYYASGEESEGQVLLRFERLGVSPTSIVFSNAVEVGGIVSAARTMTPSIVIVDSIQTMMVEDADAFPGTPTAVRAATSELIAYAKTTNIPVLIIGQVTKEGTVAGPKTLEHLVDTLLTLEGDAETAYRILRSSKNRFGATDEVGVFEMTEKGMIAVENPSARFLSERVPCPGSVVTCVMEGSRPFLVEIQALVDRSIFPNPVRRTSGYDASRLQMLLAIVGKRAGVKVNDHDVYVNVVGGLKVSEKAADLAVAAAIMSAMANKVVPANTVVVGELGLGGEVRNVPFLDRRLKEADRLGLTAAITPKTVKSIAELLK
ncbi:MAG: DNA repair protein RadA [Patescibacteria group bacterium]